MTETLTSSQIADELRAMADHTQRHPGVMQRTFNTTLLVMYEFIEGDGHAPYHMTITRERATVEAGARDYADCDVVIRTTPESLHMILSGQLGGREAVVSGRLDIRKAPSMPKLLMMRGMFNRYRKSLQGKPFAGLADSDASTECELEQLATPQQVIPLDAR